MSDYGTTHDAADIYDTNMFVSDPVDVPGLGDRAAIVSHSLSTTPFVQKGQCMVSVLAYGPVTPPTADAMAPIAARVLPSL